MRIAIEKQNNNSNKNSQSDPILQNYVIDLLNKEPSHRDKNELACISNAMQRISSLSYFSTLTRDQQTRVSKCLRVLHIPAYAPLVLKGTLMKRFYVILEGHLLLESASSVATVQASNVNPPEFINDINTTILPPGSTLGSLSLVFDLPSESMVISSELGCTVVYLEGIDFLCILKLHEFQRITSELNTCIAAAAAAAAATTTTSLLHRKNIFSGLTKKEQLYLYFRGKKQHFTQHQCIAQIGHPIKYHYLLLRGRLQIRISPTNQSDDCVSASCFEQQQQQLSVRQPNSQINSEIQQTNFIEEGEFFGMMMAQQQQQRAKREYDEGESEIVWKEMIIVESVDATCILFPSQRCNSNLATRKTNSNIKRCASSNQNSRKSPKNNPSAQLTQILNNNYNQNHQNNHCNNKNVITNENHLHVPFVKNVVPHQNPNQQSTNVPKKRVLVNVQSLRSFKDLSNPSYSVTSRIGCSPNNSTIHNESNNASSMVSKNIEQALMIPTSYRGIKANTPESLVATTSTNLTAGNNSTNAELLLLLDVQSQQQQQYPNSNLKSTSATTTTTTTTTIINRPRKSNISQHISVQTGTFPADPLLDGFFFETQFQSDHQKDFLKKQQQLFNSQQAAAAAAAAASTNTTQLIKQIPSVPQLQLSTRPSTHHHHHSHKSMPASMQLPIQNLLERWKSPPTKKQSIIVSPRYKIILRHEIEKAQSSVAAAIPAAAGQQTTAAFTYSQQLSSQRKPIPSPSDSRASSQSIFSQINLHPQQQQQQLPLQQKNSEIIQDHHNECDDDDDDENLSARKTGRNSPKSSEPNNALPEPTKSRPPSVVASEKKSTQNSQVLLLTAQKSARINALLRFNRNPSDQFRKQVQHIEHNTVSPSNFFTLLLDRMSSTRSSHASSTPTSNKNLFDNNNSNLPQSTTSMKQQQNKIIKENVYTNNNNKYV